MAGVDDKTLTEFLAQQSRINAQLSELVRAFGARNPAQEFINPNVAASAPVKTNRVSHCGVRLLDVDGSLNNKVLDDAVFLNYNTPPTNSFNLGAECKAITFSAAATVIGNEQRYLLPAFYFNGVFQGYHLIPLGISRAIVGTTGYIETFPSPSEWITSEAENGSVNSYFQRAYETVEMSADRVDLFCVILGTTGKAVTIGTTRQVYASVTGWGK